MKTFLAGLFLLMFGNCWTQSALPALGSWREHLPYGSAIDVAASQGIIYCATPYSLFTVDTRVNPEVIERWSKVTGLSETGISTIFFDEPNEKLLIAYSNSNIDFIRKGSITNLPDIKRDNVIGDKTIYRVYSLAGKYYLSSGLGVIVIDGEKNEVSDTWIIGNNGNRVRVNGFTSDGQYFYAATEEGLKRALITGPNLSNFASWQLVNNGLGPGACQHVMNVAGKIIVQKSDSLFVRNINTWSLLYSDGWPIVNSNNSGGKIQLCERQATGASRVLILNSGGVVERTISQPGVISFPRQAIIVDNNVWVADQFGGLSHFTSAGYEQYKPNSPEATASGQLIVDNSVFYATAGEVNDSWNYQYNGNGIYRFANGLWENINRFKYPILDSLLDFITIAVDRRDASAWAGSYGGGLLHIKEGPVFEIYKQTVLGPTIGDPTSYRVAGLAFDGENNLWVSNYGSSQPLRVRKSDGAWQNFTLPFFLNENALAQIIIDDNNYKWIVSPKGNGLVCFDHGSSIDNTGDDRWRLYQSGSTNGNLPSSDVTCVAKDKSGFIWVGTSDGIGVIQCPNEAFTGAGCPAIWPVVQEGNFANYLFKGQVVHDIAVDAADRKWVATKSGVWLINPTGEKIIYQFNENNSPLLSSDVRKIAIDGITGEVYFATSKGICSFRSTATDPSDTKTDVLIYPNPVPPGFNGTIGIKGLVANSTVKITHLDGRLVYQTRALGGQAVWDGRDYLGRKIVTGVYLVLVNNEDKTQKAVGKIVFIGK